jgi:large subunit ribosomal protein L15
MPLHMRLPKLKGFKNPFKVTFQVVNLDRISALFPEGGDVTPETLVAKGAVRKGELVKVLGQGELTVKVSVSANAFSASAKEKIESAGGTITVL